MGKYCKDAVNREIKRDPRIKGKEAKAIHRLLKGREQNEKHTYSIGAFGIKPTRSN